MPGPVKLLQISDLHLTTAPGHCYRQRDVWHQLDAVLDHLRTHHGDADGLLVTGDLVHDGDGGTYRALGARLDRAGLPWYWIPGNHDQPALMRAAWGDPVSRLRLGSWRVLLLDSTDCADGRGAGSLFAAELARLEAERVGSEPLLVVLHHNPVPVDSLWQDAISLGNADAFWARLDPIPAPVTVLFGHVHQTWDRAHRGRRLLSCPSTAVQFRKGQESLVLESDGEAALPGYRWLQLLDGGQVRTAIERVRLA